MLDVPYFKQDTTYTCGPTVLQMVFRFYGIITSERDLSETLQTNRDIGTRHQHMIDVVREHGLYAYVNNSSTIDEVVYLVETERVPVIVHFIEPSTDGWTLCGRCGSHR